jgi:glycogen phosphorylase
MTRGETQDRRLNRNNSLALHSTTRSGGSSSAILVEEGNPRKIRMESLAIVGSRSTNGVAAVHSKLLRTTTVKDLAEMFPDRFNNKTNGLTPRRWLLDIGEGWITDLSQLNKLKPFAEDHSARELFHTSKRRAKIRFADWLKSTSGQIVDPETIFDGQAHP